MRILANGRINRLFGWVLLLSVGFSAASGAAVRLYGQGAAWFVLAGALCMGAMVCAALFFYFRQQEKIMEEAVEQIRAYLSGDRDARIDCNEEGELYRLFHEVNSLAATLNAHAENEGRAKLYLKDTISNISHQLKTPLAALNIYNGILQEEAQGSPTIREFADLSEQELDRIETLVQNLLKIAKWDSGTIVLEKRKENLAELLGGIEKHFAYQAQREEKKLVFSGGDEVTLLCDRGWMVEAISNLVKNALDHTKTGDTIQVEWRQLASMVQIVVRDNGSGIHPEDLPHIFKRFYRSRFSKDTQGVGLGLPLTKAVVEAHRGTIEVDSDPGRGAIFTISFLIPTKL